MPTSHPKDKLPLSKDERARFNELRPLSCYRLNYVNERYPLLSFLYAIYAGGEHALYCDHPADFAQAYLTGPGGAEAMAVFARLMPRYERQEPDIQPGSKEWDDIMPLLRAELEQEDPPLPMW